MLSTKTYLSIALVFLIIFIMFVSVTLIVDNLAGASLHSLAGPAPAISARDALGESFFDLGSDPEIFPLDAGAIPGTLPETAPLLKNRQAALITAGPDDARAGLLKEWCIYNKYYYRVFTGLPAVEEIEKYDLVLFGDPALGEPEAAILEEYGATGIPLVFTRLPSYQVLAESPRLTHFLGIKEGISPSYPINGIKIFADFFLSGERLYTAGDDYGTKEDLLLELPYYTLRPGYEVYAVAILRDPGQIRDEDLPPLLWRTYSGSSLVFVVNSEVFAGKKILGTITAFLSQAYGAYLYPVVNGQTIVILNYPTFAQENSSKFQTCYTRTPQSFKREILWPNIVKVLRHYDQSYAFFALPRLNGAEMAPMHGEDVLNYWKEVTKLNGMIGLSLEELSAMPLAQVLAYNEQFFQNAFPDYRFTALYSGHFSLAELEAGFKNYPSPLFQNVSLVLTSFREDEPFFQYLGNDVLTLLTTKDGFEHKNLDDLQMIAYETALGYCIQEVNLARALFPEEQDDDWSRLAESWSAGKTYYNDFQVFDHCSIYELENRVRHFLALNYQWRAEKDRLQINIDNLAGKAGFILRVHHAEIANITGGTYRELSAGAYLIQAQKAAVSIGLRETNFLLPPDRNRETLNRDPLSFSFVPSAERNGHI